MKMEKIKDRKGNVLYTVKADNRRSAILQLVKDRVNIKGADLRCSVLKNTDLRGADFSGAYLLGADFDQSRKPDLLPFATSLLRLKSHFRNTWIFSCLVNNSYIQINKLRSRNVIFCKD